MVRLGDYQKFPMDKLLKVLYYRSYENTQLRYYEETREPLSRDRTH
jgi:hypothetical protein